MEFPSRCLVCASGQAASAAHLLPTRTERRTERPVLQHGVGHHPRLTTGVHLGGQFSPSIHLTGLSSHSVSMQRTVKRLRLSKVKTTKYFDSGCLAVFYLVSVVWGMDIIISRGYATDPSQLWTGYPHTLMRYIARVASELPSHTHEVHVHCTCG